MDFGNGDALGACTCKGAQGCRDCALTSTGQVLHGPDTWVGRKIQLGDVIVCCGSSESMSAAFSSVDDAARGVLLLEDPGSTESSASRLDRRDRGRGSDDGSVFERRTLLLKSKHSSEK